MMACSLSMGQPDLMRIVLPSHRKMLLPLVAATCRACRRKAFLEDAEVRRRQH